MQTKHRQELERAVILGNVRIASRSNYFAAVLGLVGLLLVGEAILLNHVATAVAVMIASIGGRCGIFIYGTESRKRERERKAQRLAEPTNADDGEMSSDSR